MRVAALHDDSTQHQISQQALAALGHDCHRFDSSVALLRALRRESFDLLLIDWTLPDFSGLEVLRWARVQLKERVPVLFVTESRNEADVIEGLAAGADDFMVKPVRIDELGARINALLRRSYHRQQESDLVFGRYRLEPATRRALIGDAAVALKQKEFDLALFLFQNLGRLLSREHLLQAVWGAAAEVTSRSLDTHASRVRTKLALTPDNGFRLAAVYGVGYRLEAVSAPVSTAATERPPEPPSRPPTRRP
ncbi:MAG: response regulator transcription factor [Burkholderiaceae bacterium]